MSGRILAWMKSLIGRGEIERRMDEEMRFHRERRVEHLMAKGQTREGSERNARLEFGSVDKSKENCREARGISMVEGLWQDLRFALRMVRKNPGFTATVVLTLGLGMGVNTAVFTLFNDIFLRPLPLPHPEQIVKFSRVAPKHDWNSFDYPTYRYLRDQNSVLAGLIATCNRKVVVGGPAAAEAVKPEQIWALFASGNYFSTLKARAAAGRVFLEEEDDPASDHSAVVLSYAYWERRFGKNPEVVGSKLVLNDHPFIVVGVAAYDFNGLGLASPDVWIPLRLVNRANPGGDLLALTNQNWLQLSGRLQTGVTAPAAQAQLSVLVSQYAKDHREKDLNVTMVTKLTPSAEEVGENLKPAVMMFVGVAFLLLLASANVANLMLARSSTRHREIAVRLSLGAGRGRLMRQLLTESVLLAMMSGAVAMLIGYWVAQLLVWWSGEPFRGSLMPDWRVFLYVAMVAFVTGIGFGLLPALQASRPDVYSSLKQRSRHPGRMMPGALVGAQVAISLALLTVSALIVRGVGGAMRLDLGFEPKHVLVASFDLRLHAYTRASAVEFYRRMTQRVRDLPGVVNCALAANPPLGDSGDTQGVRTDKGVMIIAHQDWVSPEYFATLRLPLLRGRTFTEDAVRTGSRVVLVSESFARLFFGGEEPLGRHLTNDKKQEIIGVTKDTLSADMNDREKAYIYQPPAGEMHLLVRTDAPFTAIIPAIRQQVREVDSKLQMEIYPLEENIQRRVQPMEAAAKVSTALALLALALASVGIYGFLTYAVEQRTHEIGIRMALGASRGAVLGLVVRQGTWQIVMGLAAGVALAAALGQTLRSMLFGLSPVDPISYGVAAIALGAMALLATCAPAARATRVDPLVALRHE
jgi:predicted permease